MNHFPIFVDLLRAGALIVGGGELAARKARLALRAGPVSVVAPSLCDELLELAEARRIGHLARPFRSADVKGRAVVFGATGHDAVDTEVSRAAQAAGVPVNVVDRPELSTFVMPAIVDRDPVTVAIGTGGAAPVLARQIRARIESVLPARLGRVAAFAERFRGAVKAAVADPEARRRFWERFFDGPVARQVLDGDERGAAEAMLRLVNSPAEAEGGSVALVGTGPGDPDLLTFRALRAMQNADVVVHDKLIGPEILELVRRDAERIYAGKSKADHSRTQDEINALMAEHALAGKRVVRLKGGDPFVFGRGGEEMDYLRARGVAVEVVPGITAATGCAAAAGIPLTHRDLAHSAVFVSGHAKDGAPELDWPALARSGQTLVIYMGLSTAPALAERLVAHGLPAATPAAIVEKGTLPDQRVVTGTVAELPAMASGHGMTGPALIVVGEVVRLARAEALPELARAAAS